MLVPTRLHDLYKTRRPSWVQGRPRASLDDEPEVIRFAHAREGLAQRANLPQHEAERVDVDLLVVHHATAADLRRHEALAARHARHLPMTENGK